MKTFTQSVREAWRVWEFDQVCGAVCERQGSRNYVRSQDPRKSGNRGSEEYLWNWVDKKNNTEKGIRNASMFLNFKNLIK